VRFAPLQDLLGSCDIVSLHVPLSDKTRDMIGQGELALMKESAILINTSRGGVVDQQALYAALRERRIAGAGLDVLAQEPPSSDDPLLQLDNVVYSPHAAGWTYESFFKRFKNSYDNISRVADGKPPRWVIPKHQGLLVERSAC